MNLLKEVNASNREKIKLEKLNKLKQVYKAILKSTLRRVLSDPSLLLLYAKTFNHVSLDSAITEILLKLEELERNGDD